MTEHVFIYTRDPDFFMLMAHILATAGYQTHHVETVGAIHWHDTSVATAALIDTSDDLESVVAFCEYLKTEPATRDIALVPLIRARHEEIYFKLLKLGIDGGFMRPVSPERIIAHLKSLSSGGQRTAEPVSEHNTHRFRNLQIDEETRTIRSGEHSTPLSPIEFRIFMRLLATSGHVVSRNALIESAWPHMRYVNPKTVDVHIANLRRTLLKIAGKPMIRTIRSNGYVVDIEG